MNLDADSIGATRATRVRAWRGLRDERVSTTDLEAALAAFEGGACETLKDDERSLVAATVAGGLPVVVKEVRKGGLRRRVADCVRGSPAARAFRGGRELIARGIGAALPLAAFEQTRLGIPLRSVLVSLDLRGDPSAAACLETWTERRPEILGALADLLAALHRQAVYHGDLRTQHVHVGTTPAGLRLRLIDLESLRLGKGKPPGAEARIDDWAQVYASIPEAHATAEQRRAAFDRYAAALPFPSSAGESAAAYEESAAAYAEIERRSLRRGHLYTATSSPA